MQITRYTPHQRKSYILYDVRELRIEEVGRSDQEWFPGPGRQEKVDEASAVDIDLGGVEVVDIGRSAHLIRGVLIHYIGAIALSKSWGVVFERFEDTMLSWLGERA
jgi:hypothetical protein